MKNGLRSILLLVVFQVACCKGYMQLNVRNSLKIDSLKKVLETEEDDTNKVNTLIETGSLYKDQSINDQTLLYYFNALKLAEEISNKEALFRATYKIANFYMNQLDNDRALEYALKAQQIAEQQNNKYNLYKIYDLIGGFIYFNAGKYNEAFPYGNKMMRIAMQDNDKVRIRYMQAWFGDLYRLARKFDSSVIMYSEALETAKALGDKEAIADCLHGIGMGYLGKHNYKEGMNYYMQSINYSSREGLFKGSYTMNAAHAYLEMHQYDSALVYAKISLNEYSRNSNKSVESSIYKMLSEIYASMGNYKEAYNNKIIYNNINDSLNSTELQNKLFSIQQNYKSEKQNKEIDFLEKKARLQKTLRNVMIVALLLFIISIVLIANKYYAKRKSESILNSKNNQLVQTLNELKSTQQQLIQSEKMASLGELTAGIAHEIQNPLNFVNNFSEVNKELIEELQDEAGKGNIDEVKAIANDIKDNEEKINYHGKRADAIVKGMLQHSRSSVGEKEPTDINALCDEYLRLSYHGLRAKEKDFNVEIKTDFDESIGKINIVPQDIGRVLLNLYNNAFYAVNQKQIEYASKELTTFEKLSTLYEPIVSVTTKKEAGKVLIIVSDNGNGIPQNIVDKIFQPFFTTKPTGQGTGLGLSLSYDIIKAHGGEIKVETKEGEGGMFIIQLPLNI